MFNTNATTVNFAGAATTLLNIANGSSTYAALDIGNGTGGSTFNIGNGATSTNNDIVNIGSTNNNSSLTLNAGAGNLALASTGTYTVTTTSGSSQTYNIANNLATAFEVEQGSNAYININTTSSGGNPTLAFGNASNNPAFSFLGSGAVTISGNTLAINGSSPAITTSSTGTASIFNGSAATIDLGGAATTLAFGATTGTATIENANVTLGQSTGITTFNTQNLSLAANNSNLDMSGTGTLSINDITDRSVSVGKFASTGTFTLNQNTINLAGFSPAITATESGSTLEIDSNGSGTLNLNGTNGTGNVNIAGGSGSTGCTITNSSGAIACSGSFTTTGAAGGVIPFGYFQRDFNTGIISFLTANTTDSLALTSATTNNSVLNLTASALGSTQPAFNNTATITGGAGNYYGQELTLTNNPTAADTAYGQYINMTDSGTHANTQVGLYIASTSNSHGDTNYSAIFNGGAVGIGTSSPAEALSLAPLSAIGAYLATPGIPTLTAGTSGSLTAHLYYVTIAAVDENGNTTIQGPENNVTTSGTNGSITTSWTAVTGASQYRVYYGQTSGAENTYYTTSNNSGYIITGNSPTSGSLPTAGSEAYAVNLNLSGTGNASIQGQLTLGGSANGSNDAVMSLSGSNFTTAIPNNGNYIVSDGANSYFSLADGSTTTTLSLGVSGSANGIISFANSGGNTAATISTDSNGDLSITTRNGASVDVGSGNGAIQLLPSGANPVYVSLAVAGATGDFQILKGATTFADFLHTGLIGFGTTSPLASFDVRSESGTTAVASISGATSFAGLVVNNSGPGDLLTASSSGLNRFVVKQNGAVGINTSNPAFTLDIQTPTTGYATATSAARIYNTSNSTTASGLDVQLGFTTPSGTNNHFINFENGNGLILGDIRDTGSGTNPTIAYQTNGVGDLAEYLPKDLNTPLNWGDVLCEGSDGNVADCDGSNNKIVGVASEFPAFVGGVDNGDASITVGLVGQVETNVSTANGNIQPGDMITESSTPGVGELATQPGEIVGKAIQGYSGSGVGQVLVAVEPGFGDPNNELSHLTFDSNGNIPANELDLTSPTIINGQTVSTVQDAITSLANEFASTADQVASNSAQIIQNSNIINNIGDEVASMAAQLNNITTNTIAGIQSTYTGSGSALTIDSAGDVNINTEKAEQLNVNGNISTQTLTLNGQDLGTALATQSSQINNLDMSLTSLQSDFTGLSTQVATNSAQIAQANNTLSSLTDQIASANATLSNITDQIASGAAVVANLTNEINPLLTGINSNYSGSTSAITINQLGQVGIGTTIPNYKLDIQEATSSAVAQIVNESSDATSIGLQIQLGTTSPQSTNQFISFLDGNGNQLGSIRGNGTSNTVTFDGNGGDFAEYFQKANPSDTFNAGDLICHAPTDGVEKCGSDSTGILGVLSNDASFVGNGRNGDNPDDILVGLIGQLQVNVASDSGFIKSGDPITFSSTEPGKAIKATQVGQIVGRALTSYDSATGNGKLLISINVGWFDPTVTLTSNGNLAINGQPMSTSQLTVAVNNLQSQTSSLSSFESKTSSSLQSAQNEISSLQQQVASLSGNLINNQGQQQPSNIPVASSESIFALSNLSDQISNLEKQLLNLNTNTSLSSQDATISGTLNVFGNTTLNNLGVTGTISTGLMTIQGLDQIGQASINTVGDLKLQDQGAGGLDILNGKIKIDTKGNFVSKGEITARKINISTGDVLSASLGNTDHPCRADTSGCNNECINEEFKNLCNTARYTSTCFNTKII